MVNFFELYFCNLVILCGIVGVIVCIFIFMCREKDWIWEFVFDIIVVWLYLKFVVVVGLYIFLNGGGWCKLVVCYLVCLFFCFEVGLVSICFFVNWGLN